MNAILIWYSDGPNLSGGQIVWFSNSLPKSIVLKWFCSKWPSFCPKPTLGTKAIAKARPFEIDLQMCFDHWKTEQNGCHIVFGPLENKTSKLSVFSIPMVSIQAPTVSCVPLK